MSIGRYQASIVNATVRHQAEGVYEIYMPQWKGRNHPPGSDQLQATRTTRRKAISWLRVWAANKGVSVNLLYFSISGEPSMMPLSKFKVDHFDE